MAANGRRRSRHQRAGVSDCADLGVALDALRDGRFETALPVLECHANAGVALAQYHLAWAYANGDGVGLNYVVAGEWMLRAAHSGFAPAQARIAWMYANGLGVDHDDLQAGRWYRAAAEQGSANAQYMLATMYRWGRYGAERDAQQMLRWYSRAAESGFAPAQYQLGKLAMEGKHVDRNPLVAFRWLVAAATNGSASAKKSLEKLHAQMSPNERRAAQALLSGKQDSRGSTAGRGQHQA